MRTFLPLILLTGCGLDLDWPSDSGDEVADLSSLLDHSVNDARIGVEDDVGGLLLRTEEGDNEVGAFNGSGTGNKAIGGVLGWSGVGLGDLSGLAVETQLVGGSTTPYFNLVLDLDGTGSTLNVIVTDTSMVDSPEDLGDGVTRYAFAADAPQWKAVGGLDDLLPEHLSSEGGTLTSVLAAYPDACLRDADTGDNGLPAGVVTSAVMIILGDSLNHSQHEHRVSALDVGDTRYE